jgi:putative transposase
VIVHQAYRFALDPTRRQQGALASHVGGARFAYNWGLELVKRRLGERAAGQDVEVPWTLPALRREWNRAKAAVAPWWAENSKEASSSGLDALARGLRNRADAKQGRRAGARVGFPRRKRKGHGRLACRFSTGAIRVEADRHHVTLPRLGCLKTHESTRKLGRRMEQGTARILAATISQQGGRWFVSFTCQVQRAQRRPRRPAARVGVDVGVRQLAVLSSGQQVANLRPLAAALRRLRRINRQLARQRGPRAPDGTLRRRRRAGARPSGSWPAAMPGWPTCALRHCISSPPAWPQSTARLWWSGCMWPGWSEIGGSPGRSPTRVWARSVACLATSADGPAGGWWRPTPSLRRRRPARAVGR